MSAKQTPKANAAMRLDVWLWRARQFKTRAAAAACILEGGVRLSERGQFAASGKGPRFAKPASLARIGDAITFPSPRGVISLRILALPARRGPPAEARACYAPIGSDTSATLDEGASHPSSSTSFDF